MDQNSCHNLLSHLAYISEYITSLWTRRKKLWLISFLTCSSFFRDQSSRFHRRSGAWLSSSCPPLGYIQKETEENRKRNENEIYSLKVKIKSSRNVYEWKFLGKFLFLINLRTKAKNLLRRDQIYELFPFCLNKIAQIIPFCQKLY